MPAVRGNDVGTGCKACVKPICPHYRLRPMRDGRSPGMRRDDGEETVNGLVRGQASIHRRRFVEKVRGGGD